jgi:hypothetical protein
MAQNVDDTLFFIMIIKIKTKVKKWKSAKEGV